MHTVIVEIKDIRQFIRVYLYHSFGDIIAVYVAEINSARKEIKTVEIFRVSVLPFVRAGADLFFNFIGGDRFDRSFCC